MFHIFTYTNGFIGICICLVAITGDLLGNKVDLFLIRALCDNITHMVIAGLSWLIVVRNMKYTHSLQEFQVILCALIGSFIDLDHFLVAKTIDYREIQNNLSRGIFHITTIPIVICIFMLIWAQKFVTESINITAWIILTAFLSHHIRDATRRGFLMTPFGSTPHLPYFYYIFLLIILPVLISYGEYLTSHFITKTKSQIQNNRPLLMNLEDNLITCMKKMSNEFMAETLKRIVATIIRSIGFNVSQDSCLKLLSGILHNYLRNMCKDLKLNTENCGRTKPNLNDLLFLFKYVNLDINSLLEYVKCVEIPFEDSPLPIIPVKRINRDTLRPKNVVSSAPLITSIKKNHLSTITVSTLSNRNSKIKYNRRPTSQPNYNENENLKKTWRQKENIKPKYKQNKNSKINTRKMKPIN